MKLKTTLMTTAAAAAVATSVAALAQPEPSNRTAAKETPVVFHAGGRHDQKLHEAAIRARANGHRMDQGALHAGGRHDARTHDAAMKAEAKRGPGGDPGR